MALFLDIYLRQMATAEQYNGKNIKSNDMDMSSEQNTDQPLQYVNQIKSQTPSVFTLATLVDPSY